MEATWQPPLPSDLCGQAGGPRPTLPSTSHGRAVGLIRTHPGMNKIKAKAPFLGTILVLFELLSLEPKKALFFFFTIPVKAELFSK